MISYRVEVRVVLEPLPLAHPARDRSFEAVDRFFALVQARIDARDVVKDQRIVGIDRDCSLRPITGHLRLSNMSIARGTAADRGRILRVELEMPVDQFQAAFPHRRRLCLASQGLVGQGEEVRRRVLLRIELHRAPKQLRRPFHISIAQTHATIHVKRVTELWVEPDRDLEFPPCLLDVASQ